MDFALVRKTDGARFYLLRPLTLAFPEERFFTNCIVNFYSNSQPDFTFLSLYNSCNLRRDFPKIKASIFCENKFTDVLNLRGNCIFHNFPFIKIQKNIFKGNNFYVSVERTESL